MLQFNRSGLLVPNTNISATLNDLETTFVNNIPNEQRSTLFAHYLNYSNQLKNISGGITFLQWIDGSFVTKTTAPHDIDLVTFLDYQIVQQLGASLQQFIYPSSLYNFEVDAYIVTVFPKEHPSYFLFQSDEAYWKDKFDKAKSNRIGKKLAKGFLEINY